jgi:hypothetical protein
MPRKKQTAKKRNNKKGKGIIQEVNHNDATIRLIDDKGNIIKRLPPTTTKREIRQHIKKLNSNINSPNKTKKGFLRKFLKIFKKKSRKKSTPILVRIQDSFNKDFEDYRRLGITVTKLR